MSEATKTALDIAIAEHFADECDDAILSGYVLQMIGGNLADYDAGQQMYFRAALDGQPFILTLGLAHYMAQTLDQSAVTFD